MITQKAWRKDQGLLSVKELWVHPVEFREGNPIQLGLTFMSLWLMRYPANAR